MARRMKYRINGLIDRMAGNRRAIVVLFLLNLLNAMMVQ